MLPVSGLENLPTNNHHQRFEQVPLFYVIDRDGVIANAGFAGTLEQLEALVEAGVE